MQIFLVTQSEDRLLKKEFVYPSPLTLADFLSLNHIKTGDGYAVSVWGNLKPGNYQLQDKDRVEVCGPLLVDPKVARSRRAGLRSDNLSSGRRRHATQCLYVEKTKIEAVVKDLN